MNKISFQYVISEWANLYFFVQNLSMWHESNNNTYNIEWRKLLPVLTVEQEKLLISFRELRRSEPTSNSVFEKAFFESARPMTMLRHELLEKDYDLLVRVFEEFKPFFKKIYVIERPKLIIWKKRLEQFRKQNGLNVKIERDLEIFYNEKIKKNKTLICHLLICPIGHGGSFIAEGIITQAISSFPIQKDKEVYATIWHEVIHAYFDKFYLKELLMESKTKTPANVLKELIASSLLPLGYLGKKHLGLDYPIKIYRQYNYGETKTKKIINLSKEYIDSGLTVDNAFINKLEKIIS